MGEERSIEERGKEILEKILALTIGERAEVSFELERLKLKVGKISIIFDGTVIIKKAE
jgi:hypothetical protein